MTIAMAVLLSVFSCRDSRPGDSLLPLPAGLGLRARPVFPPTDSLPTNQDPRRSVVRRAKTMWKPSKTCPNACRTRPKPARKSMVTFRMVQNGTGYLTRWLPQPTRKSYVMCSISYLKRACSAHVGSLAFREVFQVPDLPRHRPLARQVCRGLPPGEPGSEFRVPGSAPTSWEERRISDLPIIFLRFFPCIP